MKSEDIVGLPCIYRISVKAMICDDQDRILLIRTKGHGWEFPGGGLEHDESPHHGLIRELEEEIGARVSWNSQSPTAFWTMHADKGPRWFGFVLYDVRLSSPPLAGKAGEEGEEIGYFSLDDIDTLELNQNTLPYFRHDYENYKKHTGFSIS